MTTYTPAELAYRDQLIADIKHLLSELGIDTVEEL
jgi:hypothetical protein